MTIGATDKRKASARPMKRVDLAADIWTTAECSAYLRQSADTFRKVTRHKPGFPEPLAHLGGRYWSAREVKDWALPPPIPRPAAKPLKIRAA